MNHIELEKPDMDNNEQQKKKIAKESDQKVTSSLKKNSKRENEYSLSSNDMLVLNRVLYILI